MHIARVYDLALKSVMIYWPPILGNNNEYFTVECEIDFVLFLCFLCAKFWQYNNRQHQTALVTIFEGNRLLLNPKLYIITVPSMFYFLHMLCHHVAATQLCFSLYYFVIVCLSCIFWFTFISHNLTQKIMFFHSFCSQYNVPYSDDIFAVRGNVKICKKN